MTATAEAPVVEAEKPTVRSPKFQQLSLLDRAEILLSERRVDAAAMLMVKEYLEQRNQPRLEAAPSPGAQLALSALAKIYNRSRVVRRELNKLADAGDQDVVDFIPQIKLARKATPSRAFVEAAIAIGELYRGPREARERAVAEQQRLEAETKRLTTWRKEQALLPSWQQDPAYQEWVWQQSRRSR